MGRYEFVRSFSSLYSYQPVFTTSSFQFKYIAKNSYKIPASPECPECPEPPVCPKLPECPKLPDCKGEKLSDLSEYQKLANIQYQRDVRGVWISDTKLKYEDADENIKIFNSDDEKSTEFITFQTLNGYKKLELTGKFELLITFFT